MTDKRIEIIAMVAHAVNAAYCLSIGDNSQPTWDSAPDWQKQSVINGVNMHLQNPDATPEQSHKSWLEHKVKEGWVYGEEKDEEAKTHPCVLPFEKLPPEQKSKDYLFRGVVHALKDLPLTDDSGEIESLKRQLAEALATGPAKAGTSIKYIGIRPYWSDTIYGTGLTFIAGQTRTVPPTIAEKLLNHPDVFELSPEAPKNDDTERVLAKAEGDKEEEGERENNHYEVLDKVRTMTRGGLIEYAKERYQVNLGSRISKADALKEVEQLINQFGAL